MTTRRVWRPLERVEPSQHYLRVLKESGENIAGKEIQIWANEFYQVTARIYPPDGFTHLSIKRENRYPIHDWRQLQQIKNEVCGPEREAVEVYPAESRIVDTANEYHLWVLPEGTLVPFAFDEGRQLMTPEQIEEFNRETKMVDRHGQQVSGKARQRGWQPGLSTGLGDANV